MALDWDFDLVGSRFSDGEDRITYTRRAKAKGIVATTPAAAYAEVYSDPGIPVKGSQLDATLYPLVLMTSSELTRLECHGAAGSRFAEVTFQYKGFTTSISVLPDDDGPVIVTISGGLVEKETSIDRIGAALTTVHNGETRAATVSILVPVTVIQCDRLEVSTSKARADTYLGRVNSASWNGYAARTVLCEAIESSTDDGGDSFNVTYRFRQDPDGWDQTIVHRTPAGEPVLSPVASVGIKTVEIYDEVSFAGLNITL